MRRVLVVRGIKERSREKGEEVMLVVIDGTK
jgi:hypothetical protein